MINRNWLKSNSQQRRLFAGRTTSFLRKWMPPPEMWGCAAILIMLALSLTGCAHNSPSPCPEQKLPPVPALTEPIPPESYSLRAQQSFKAWQERLIATPVTP